MATNKDLDELTEELSEDENEKANKETKDQDTENSNDNDNDVSKDLIDIPSNVIDLKLVIDTYGICCAHAIQLVLKDGIQLDEEYTKLIKKVSKDIVSKTKISNIIAEEIRNLEKVLLTYVITRWNSILFMIRSVLRLTDEDFRSVRDKMPRKTKKQRKTRKSFELKSKERAMLEELAQILEHFESLTDNLQTNEVSI